jgi:hypothetical protein
VRPPVDVGCTAVHEFEVEDAARLFHCQQDSGHHFAVVFGDYVEDLKHLGYLAGFEVVEA